MSSPFRRGGWEGFEAPQLEASHRCAALRTGFSTSGPRHEQPLPLSTGISSAPWWTTSATSASPGGSPVSFSGKATARSGSGWTIWPASPASAPGLDPAQGSQWVEGIHIQRWYDALPADAVPASVVIPRPSPAPCPPFIARMAEQSPPLLDQPGVSKRRGLGRRLPRPRLPQRVGSQSLDKYFFFPGFTENRRPLVRTGAHRRAGCLAAG